MLAKIFLIAVIIFLPSEIFGNINSTSNTFFYKTSSMETRLSWNSSETIPRYEIHLDTFSRPQQITISISNFSLDSLTIPTNHYFTLKISQNSKIQFAVKLFWVENMWNLKGNILEPKWAAKQVWALTFPDSLNNELVNLSISLIELSEQNLSPIDTNVSFIYCREICKHEINSSIPKKLDLLIRKINKGQDEQPIIDSLVDLNPKWIEFFFQYTKQYKIEENYFHSLNNAISKSLANSIKHREWKKSIEIMSSIKKIGRKSSFSKWHEEKHFDSAFVILENFQNEKPKVETSAESLLEDFFILKRFTELGVIDNWEGGIPNYTVLGQFAESIYRQYPTSQAAEISMYTMAFLSYNKDGYYLGGSPIELDWVLNKFPKSVFADKARFFKVVSVLDATAHSGKPYCAFLKDYQKYRPYIEEKKTASKLDKIKKEYPGRETKCLD